MTSSLFVLSMVVPSPLAEGVGRLLVLAGAGAVEEAEQGNDTELVVYSERRTALVRIARRASGALRKAGIRLSANIHAAPRTASGWDRQWQGALSPVRISPTLELVPTRGEPALRAADQVLLEPAFAFGFGEHPTTRIAASEVERRCRRGNVRSMLDVGTGTGILALVAALRGAERVRGIDTDRRAILAARRNAERNGVSRQCRFAVGTVSRVHDRFDLVLANLDLRTLLTLPGQLKAVVAESGVLLVTGFLSRDIRDVIATYEAHGFVKRHGRREDGWALIALTRRRSTTGQRVPRATAPEKVHKNKNRSPVRRASRRVTRTRRRT